MVEAQDFNTHDIPPWLPQHITLGDPAAGFQVWKIFPPRHSHVHQDLEHFLVGLPRPRRAHQGQNDLLSQSLQL